MKTKQKTKMKKNLSQTFLRLLMVLLVLPMAIVNARASVSYGEHFASATTADPAQGLVYMSQSNEASVASSKFKYYYPGGSLTSSAAADNTESNNCYISNGTDNGCTPKNMFFWARPTRGYEFKSWEARGTNYAAHPSSTTGSNTCNQKDELNQGPYFGTADIIQTTAGGQQATWMRPIATFKGAAMYIVTYAVPVGGSYDIQYRYLTTYKTGATELGGNDVYAFQISKDNYSMTPSTEDPEEIDSFKADTVILSVSSDPSNFLGWYEGETKLSENTTYQYPVSAAVTVHPLFKWIEWGKVTGNLTINTTDIGVTDDGKNVYIPYTLKHGDWEVANFQISTTALSNAYGSIEFGDLTIDEPNNRLVLPYSYTSIAIGDFAVTVTITPEFGSPIEFVIATSAEAEFDKEACIEENGVRTYTGTLAKMMAQANSMNNKPTLKLMNDRTITTPLSFTNSFTFDVNGKTLTANCASAFSIDATDIDVKIVDGSFTQVGEIHTSFASDDPVSVVSFTHKAKLTMQGGTLSAENTGTGSAYGLSVSNGSIFYMTNGQLTISAATGDAQGVHVATTNDYATFNGGSLTVTAPTYAYGVWSAGQSNITDATIDVETTTGANAYGVYVNGGTATVTTTDFAVNAKTANAYGAYVNAGRMNFNGGKLTVEAVTSDVYGVHVASGATAMMQQNAKVTAKATGVSGTNVIGINNLGTVSLNNIKVTATSPTTTATAVNTATDAVRTDIEDGTYTANAQTGTAYGLYHQYGELNVDGAIFKGVLKASGTNAYGARLAADGEIVNAILHAETKGTGSTVYGFYIEEEDKNITLTNCTITGKSRTDKAYAIYSKSNVTAEGCTLTATTLGAAEAYGVYAKKGTNVIRNCNATVTARTIHAYGAYHEAGSLTIDGGTYTVEAQQAYLMSPQDSELYGLKNAAGMTTNVTNASFSVKATNAANARKVFGAYIAGTLNSTGASYNAEAKTQVYGVYGTDASSLNLSNNKVTARAANGTTCYGVYAKKNFDINGDEVRAKVTTTDVYALYFDATNSVGTVHNGKFSAVGNGTTKQSPINDAATVGNVQLVGGVYSSKANLSKYAATGYHIYNIDDTEADYAAGYYYVVATENPSPYVCKIVGGAYYPTLEAAFQYAKDNEDKELTIVLTQDYTLPSGDYELPANATLLIPHKVGQNTIYGVGEDNSNKTTTARDRAEHMRLTLASGANLNVSGTIEVSGQMYCRESGRISYNNGPYAHIQMDKLSLIQLNSGAVLYAWGYITGKGEIKVKNDAEVREMFQIYNMPSMSNLGDVYTDASKNKFKYFPVQQYFIQNIEVPTTYYYNSRLVCGMSNYYKGSMVGIGYNKDDNIRVVGTQGALFLVTDDNESSWVRKSYDVKNDMQLWEVNSSAKLGSLTIAMEEATMNSVDYILPLTSNMKIHILDGNFGITQDAQLLAGAQVEVNKTGTLTIEAKDSKNKDVHFYVFDKDQSNLTSQVSVAFSPSWTGSSAPTRTVGDAAINVHGKIDVQGIFYTTKKGASETTKTDGAKIYSIDADAGTVTFTKAAPSETTDIKLITSISGSTINTKTINMDPAKLKNGIADPAYTTTAGATAGSAYMYFDNQWQSSETNGCFQIFNDKVYAKPSEYVALEKSQIVDGKLTGVQESDFTYLTAEGKHLILMDECQWWEVEPTSDPTVFECTKEGYEGFYYYDETAAKWKLKTVTVTFYAEETGDEVLKTIVTDYNGVPDQAVIASNPTKETTAAATYTFSGWKSSVTGTEYKWTAPLEVATTDMNYRPVFTPNPRHYTVTFMDAQNGTNVPIEYEYNATPSYEPAKDPSAQYSYFFQYWLAANGVSQYAKDATLPAVTEATTYTAIWAPTINKYSVIWKNGDEVLETDTKQAYGATVSYDGATPTKAADNSFAYTHDGWALTDGGEKLTPMPTVSGEMTFYAHYNTTPRYKVTFANYDGTSLQQTYVTAGEPPIYEGLTPGRVRDLDGYYLFIGWRNSNNEYFAANATLPVVTGKETFTAQYDYVNELYLITLNNVDGAGASWYGKFGVGSTPYYNRDNNDVAVEPVKASTAQYEYTFSGWDPALVPVDGEATYTAQFEKHTRKYNITFANLDDNGASQTIEVEYGTTPVCPVDPEKATATHTYAFTGWAEGSIVSVTGEATYTAQFSSTGTPRSFPITFDPDNGVDEPYTYDVPYGENPAYPYADPEKAGDAMNNYVFSGWSPEVTAVTGPVEYTAQYTPTVRTYTITFKDNLGNTIKSTPVAYGVMPACDPAKPIDYENKKYYTYSDWSPALAIVTEDATYTVTYTEHNLVAMVAPKDGDFEPYDSWDAAISAANASEKSVMKLYSNVTATNYTQITGTFTLDLNGCIASQTNTTTSNPYLLYIKDKGALTIMDSGVGGKISYTGSANTYYYTINVYSSTSQLTVNSGIIECNKTGGSSNRNAVAVYVYSGDAYINGGELIATSTKTAYALYDYSEDVVITGGKFKASGSSASYILSSGSYTTISGGFYSMNPNGSFTLTSGKKVCVVRDSEPEKAKGYNYKVVNAHTVTFKNWNDATIQSGASEDGLLPIVPADPTRPNAEGRVYGFTGWSPTVAVVNADATYTAQYEVTGIDADGEAPIAEDITVTTTVVETSGTLNVTAGTLTTTNLILKASESASGQILDGTGTIAATNVYFDLKLNTDARHWHAFGVPWNVDVTEHALMEVETGRTLVVGRDCEIIYYNGATRASQGPGAQCWEYLKHYSEAGQPIDVMTPGKGYMIAFTIPVQTVRLTKASGAPIIYSGTVNLAANSGDADNGGWNAMANPEAYHAAMEDGPTVGYVHDGGKIGSDGYEVYDLAAKKFIVGKMVYVQAAGDQSITFNASSATPISPAAAPKRHVKVTDKQYLALSDYYAVSLSNGDKASRVYVLPEENKVDKYVIGHDLSQFSMNATKPQIWVDRYDTKLALNTTAPIAEVADFPVSIYAPTAGEYMISVQNSAINDEYTAYVTLDGQAIWNLSNSDYTLSLPQGTSTQYGIRLSAHAPQIATGLDEAVVDAKGETRKVVINDKVFIIRGDQVYSVDGQLVK